MKSTIKKIVIAAMLAAVTCIMTVVIAIPTPLKGYMNLGDCVVLLSGTLLPAPYAFLAAGVGSGLADLFAGYAMYAPATFVIKGVMALIVCLGRKLLGRDNKIMLATVAGGVTAEVFMVLGYFLFEGILYGFVPSLSNIPANAFQGTVGLLLGILLSKIFKKFKILQ